MLAAGDMIYSKHRSDRPPHHWILLTNPDSEGEALAVNITTECGDTTTICGPADHSALNHSCEVFYAEATRLDAKALEAAALAGGSATLTVLRKDPCSAAFLKKLRAGILTSTKTRDPIKASCRKVWDANGDLLL